MLGKGYWFFLVGCTYFCGILLVSADDDIDYPTLNDTWSYCFEFTWFGPEFDKTTTYNGTCDDYKDESRAGDNIPCASPIVISDDGTIPDITYLWNNHRASVLCRRAENQACVTYTYSYNGLITNQTHMCARVKTDSKIIPSECYKQKTNGYDVELCVCTSDKGLTMPCNNGAVMHRIAIGAVLIGMLIKWLI